MVKKDKSVKNNGTYIFGDFSYGLYLLDTPRYLGEQLASLALKGGQNVWCEKGALIPQYGYAKKPSIGTGERIVAVSKDSYSGASFFILCQSGKVYYYSASEGIKEYKTIFDQTPTDVKIARRGNDLILSMAGGNYVFGAWYESEDASLVEIDKNVGASDFGTYMEFQVPKESSKYYWTGKEVDVSGVGKVTLTQVDTGRGYVYDKVDLNDLKGHPYRLSGTIRVGNGIDEQMINSTTGFKTSKTTITQGTTISKTESKWLCFKASATKKNKEPLVNGTLFSAGEVPYDGYIYFNKDELNIGAKAYCAIGNDWGQSYSGIICDVKNYPQGTSKGYLRAYSYSKVVTDEAQIGIFKQKGKFWKNISAGTTQNIDRDLICAKLDANGNPSVAAWNEAGTIFNLTRYEAGDIATTTTTTETESSVDKYRIDIYRDIEYTDPSTGEFVHQERVFHTEYLDSEGIYTWEIVNSGNQYSGNRFRITKGNSEIYSFTYWGNLTCVNHAQAGDYIELGNVALYLDGSDEPSNRRLSDVVILRGISTQRDRNSLPNLVTISEKTLHSIEFKYRPEDEEITDLDYDEDEEGKYYPITVKQMEWCNNRLFIEDISGRIFYSQVGIIDGFNESYGAGYFGGFYNDTSNLLSMEDFKDGVLVTKENGMYYLTISDSVNYATQGEYLTVSTNNLKIEKLSDIGQKYPKDHCVVKNNVYAYDSNSGSLVNAVTQTVFGVLQAGKTMVSADYLNAQDLGIDNASNRALVYNAEAGVFILYYGEKLQNGIVYSQAYDSLFPRKLNVPMLDIIQFNQGVIIINEETNDILQDFKKGTIVPDINPVADFEAIGLRDNRFISSSIMEITELNGVEYDITATNISSSYQHVQPNTEIGKDKAFYPNMLYSEYNNENRIYDSFELTSKWVEKNSNLTRMYCPMSGRYGVSLQFTFPANQDFCLNSIRLPDFSQGE